MKRILSIVVSGAVIAAFSGVAAAADVNQGTEMMKKVDEQKEQAVEKQEKASGAMKKKDKVVEKAKDKKKKVKAIKEGKEKPMEKMTKAKEEGGKTPQEVNDLKKELQ